MSGSNASRNLQILQKLGLIDANRKGTVSSYALERYAVGRLKMRNLVAYTGLDILHDVIRAILEKPPLLATAPEGDAEVFVWLQALVVELVNAKNRKGEYKDPEASEGMQDIAAPDRPDDTVEFINLLERLLEHMREDAEVKELLNFIILRDDRRVMAAALGISEQELAKRLNRFDYHAKQFWAKEVAPLKAGS